MLSLSVMLTGRPVLESLVTEVALVHLQVGVDQDVTVDLVPVVEALVAQLATVHMFAVVDGALVGVQHVRVARSFTTNVTNDLLSWGGVTPSHVLVQVALAQEGFSTLGARVRPLGSMLAGVVAVQIGLDADAGFIFVQHF